MKQIISLSFLITLFVLLIITGCSTDGGGEEEGGSLPMDEDDDDDDDDSGGDDDDDDDDNDDDNDDDDDDDTVYTPPDGLEITFYDVGQGDAALLRFPGGTTMLIDGGPNHMGEQVILPHFDSLGLKNLDIMVLSHPHYDHYGGLDEVLYEVEVGEYWENGEDRESDIETYWNLSDLIDSENIPRIVLDRDDVYTVEDCDITVFNADQGVSGWDFNDNSIVMAIDCEDVITMFSGDATEKTEDELISLYGYDLYADIIKVPHHGSSDSASDFPDYVTPEYAVISCGAGNPYGHPDAGVVAEWEGVGAEVFRTDTDGTVTILANNGQMAVSTSAD